MEEKNKKIMKNDLKKSIIFVVGLLLGGVARNIAYTVWIYFFFYIPLVLFVWFVFLSKL